MMLRIAACLVLALLIEIPDVAAGYYEEWNLAALQRRYSRAAAYPQPWAGFWWPYSDNGIADASYGRDGMSPAGKIDLALGNTNWITSWEWRNHGQGRGAPDWWGHCNGWATAALLEPEPRRAVEAGGVRFEVRDRKALLSEYWLEQGSDYIGTRVWSFNDFSSAAFWDVAPAAFHLVMTNIVGRQHRGVIIDRHTGAEVWNQPVIAYEIDPIRPEDYLGADLRYGNLYRVNVSATIWWASDEVNPDDVTPEFKWRESAFFVKRKLRYELWVDGPLLFDERGNLVSSGDIVLTGNGAGGWWKNGTDPEVLVNTHPDFIWIPLSYARSSGYKNPRLNDAWVRENISDDAARVR